MVTAKKIEEIVKTGALHALYRKDGGWYHHLNKFPGVLFDYNGYIIFETKEDYNNNPALIHRQDLNVKNGISSLANYKKFSRKEIKKIESLDSILNKLNTSESWLTLVTNAKKSNAINETFFSPIHKKAYQVKSVTSTFIVIKREDSEDSKIGKSFFVNWINKINRNDGKMARKNLGGHVAKFSAIIHLHPLLEWSEDHQTVIVTFKSSNQRILKVVKSDLDSIDEENSNTFEGGSKKRLVSYYERKPKLRAKAIQIHGTTCKICQFNFKDNYGVHGEDYIEVHHLVPIHTLIKATSINPETDMIVVCANCHRMIHRKKYNPLSIEDIINLRNSAKTKI